MATLEVIINETMHSFVSVFGRFESKQDVSFNSSEKNDYRDPM